MYSSNLKFTQSKIFAFCVLTNVNCEHVNVSQIRAVKLLWNLLKTTTEKVLGLYTLGWCCPDLKFFDHFLLWAAVALVLSPQLWPSVPKLKMRGEFQRNVRILAELHFHLEQFTCLPFCLANCLSDSICKLKKLICLK